MPHYVYILYSAVIDSFYKGQTNDLESRITRHNQGGEKYTKRGIPWVLVWSTEKASRSDAILLERKLKNLSREKTIAFIKKYRAGSSPDALLLLKQLSGC